MTLDVFVFAVGLIGGLLLAGVLLEMFFTKLLQKYL